MISSPIDTQIAESLNQKINTLEGNLNNYFSNLKHKKEIYDQHVHELHQNVNSEIDAAFNDILNKVNQQKF